MKIASSESSPSTAPTSVEAVVKPKRRWALAADSDRAVATCAKLTFAIRARCGSSIEDA